MDMRKLIGVVITLLALSLLYPGIYLLEIGNRMVK